MKGNLGNLLKQAQKMQENLQKAQEELASLEITGESGGGLVKIIMTGRYEARRVTIDPNLLKDDPDLLEDLIAAAINDAVHKVERTSQEKLSGLTGGMNIPGLGAGGFKLPF